MTGPFINVTNGLENREILVNLANITRMTSVHQGPGGANSVIYFFGVTDGGKDVFGAPGLRHDKIFVTETLEQLEQKIASVSGFSGSKAGRVLIEA